MANTYAVIMAAGHGTRMQSELPKVLHRVAGRPLLYFPILAALEAGADEVVVVVNPKTAEAIESTLRREMPGVSLSFAVQNVPQGTGDAAKCGLKNLELSPADRVLILSGDTPLLRAENLKPLLEAAAQTSLALLSFIAKEPKGYGRIMRDTEGFVTGIVEEKDLQNDAERSIQEANAGVYAGNGQKLIEALGQISNQNAQGEYYLTDIVSLISKKAPVLSLVTKESDLIGVNHRVHLRQVEAVINQRIIEQHLLAGVTIRGDVVIEESVVIASDVEIRAGVELRGRTSIARGAFIDKGCVLSDSIIDAGATLLPYSVVSQSKIGPCAQLGPFSHCRPESQIGEGAKVGNFVETKKAVLGKGAKASHLAYLGDVEVGEGANLGAGTIICNYDGYRKQRTVIGAGAFIGSDSQLIAPVHIGDGAYVATGTTVTEDVPAEALAISRGRQTNKLKYAQKLKQKLQQEAQQVK